MVSASRLTSSPRSASQALVSIGAKRSLSFSQMFAHSGWFPGRSSSHRLTRPMLKTEQFKANGKPGYKFCSHVAQVSDRIVDIVLQSAASGNPFVDCLGIGFKHRGCFPTVIDKYLNLTIHSTLLWSKIRFSTDFIHYS